MYIDVIQVFVVLVYVAILYLGAKRYGIDPAFETINKKLDILIEYGNSGNT